MSSSRNARIGIAGLLVLCLIAAVGVVVWQRAGVSDGLLRQQQRDL
jgi:hypothetical protein